MRNNTMKYTLPKDAKELDKLITSAIKAAQTMKAKVQQAAIGILHHASICGDWTKANELVEGLGHGVKRDSLVEWFSKYGGLTIAEGANKFTGWKGKDHIRLHLNDAKDQMWYDLKKSNPFKGFNMNEEINKLLKRRAKVMKELPVLSEDDQAKVSLDLNEEVIQALLKASNFEAVLEPTLEEQIAEELGKAA